MNAEYFLANFGFIASAPGGVLRLRELVLQLAAMGELVQQPASDDDSDALIAQITQERRSLVASGEIKRGSPLSDVDSSSQLPNIPSHWRWIRLGNLTSKIGSGSTPRGGSKVYTSKGIPFLRSQNIWNDGIRLGEVVFIDRHTHDAMENTHVVPNDILLNITGASLGRCAIVPSSFSPANVSQHVTIIRPLLAEMWHFLRICLLSPFGQSMIWGRQVGMAREGLSKKVLEQFEIPVPPITEQRQIVARVDELMTLCDQLEAQHQERERQFPVLSLTCHGRFADAPTQTNLNRIFGDVGTVSPSHLRKTILKLAVQGKFTPSNVSKHVVLKDVIELISGQHLLAHEQNTVAKGIPYLTGPSDFGIKHPVPTRWTETPKVVAKPGDILITVKGAGVGKTNRLDQQMAISRQLMAVRVTGADPEFVHLVLMSAADHFNPQ